MLRKDIFSVCLVTFYLIIYCGVLKFHHAEIYGLVMFLFSPILMCWMVYTVLKHGKYNGPALDEEEFGYQDKAKDELGVI